MVKLRVGPGKKYQTSNLYEYKNYPVKVIAEFENWRKIEDIDGTQGWVHQTLLSGTNYAIVKDNKLAEKKSLAYKISNDQSLLFKAADENSRPVAKLELGVVVLVKKCKKIWCNVKIESVNGWIMKSNLWGAK
jgi:SH3-like domain-containing protein